MPSGESTIEIFADDDMLVQWDTADESGTQAVVQSSAVRIANSWSKDFNMTSDGIVEIITDVDAHLIITYGDEGRTSLLGEEGNYYSKYFIAPHSSGNLSITNPNANAATVTWKSGGVSVPANQTSVIPWPPSNIDSAAHIESSENILVEWGVGTNGIRMLAATDTGQVTGLQFMEDDSETIINYSSEFGDYQSKLSLDGDSGIMILEDDGAMRCIAIDQTASGWISTTLPWKSMNGLPEGQIISSWRNGEHPASIEITLIGTEGDSSHANLSLIHI